MTIQFSAAYPELTLTVRFDGSTWVDISDYVRSADTDRPSSDETGRYSPGTAVIVLDNRDGRFSTENLSGPYVDGGVSLVQPEVWVRLVAEWGGSGYNLFCGRVESWIDEYSEAGYDAVTVMSLVDHLVDVSEWNGSPVTAVGEGELSSARVARILTAAGSTLSLFTPGAATGDSRLQATTLEGNGLDQLHDVVDAEGGAIWFEPGPQSSADGTLRFLSRSGRVVLSSYSTTQATFGNNDIRYREVTNSADRQRIVRQAAYTRTGGTTQTVGSGKPRVTLDNLSNVDDATVNSLAALAVAVGDPADLRRTRSVSVDPIASGEWTDVLKLQMQHRCVVEVDVPVSGLSISRNVFVDGIAHHIRPFQWTVDFTFQSAAAWDGFSGDLWDTGGWDAATWFY